MKFITGLSIVGAFGALLSLAAPARAQTDPICEPGGPCPYVELSGGDVTCEDAIAAIPSFPNGPRPDLKYVELLIENPTSTNPKTTVSPQDAPGELSTTFAVDLLPSVTDSNIVMVTEASIPEGGAGSSSQITDLPGFEVVIMQRNNSAYAYHTNNIRSGVFAGPGTQSPTKIRVCWAIGPCGLNSQDQVDAVRGIYVAAGSEPDDLQGQRSTHFGEAPNPINVCSLTGVARFCNTSIAPGVGPENAGSCLTELFTGSSTTSVITGGIASTRFYSTGSGDSSVSSTTDTTTTPTECTINPFTGLCL